LDTDGDAETGPLIPNGYCSIQNEFNGKNPIGNIPNSNLPNYYDNGYRAMNTVEECSIIKNKIIDPHQNVSMIMWQDEHFRFNQLYTGLQSKTGETAIAFEPQSGSTNGYNNGDHLTILYPQQIFQGSFGFEVE